MCHFISTFYKSEGASQVAQHPPAMQETWVWSLDWEDALEKGEYGNPLQDSCLENLVDRGAWRAKSTGLQTVRHNWSYWACTPSRINQKSELDFPAGMVVRICLLMQETCVWSLVRDNSTCQGAAKPRRQNYRARALDSARCNYWSLCTWSPCSATRVATSVRSQCTATRE